MCIYILCVVITSSAIILVISIVVTKNVMPKPGRPKNNCFGELGFKLMKMNGKYCAFCQTCKKTLQNTAAVRLKAHRNVCKQNVAISTQRRTTNCIYNILDDQINESIEFESSNMVINHDNESLQDTVLQKNVDTGYVVMRRVNLCFVCFVATIHISHSFMDSTAKAANISIVCFV